MRESDMTYVHSRDGVHRKQCPCGMNPAEPKDVPNEPMARLQLTKAEEQMMRQLEKSLKLNALDLSSKETYGQLAVQRRGNWRRRVDCDCHPALEATDPNDGIREGDLVRRSPTVCGLYAALMRDVIGC